MDNGLSHRGMTCRRFLRLMVAATLYYSGVLRLWWRLRPRLLRRREVCVLGLHRVLSPEEEKSTCSQAGIVLREETFASLLSHLQRWFKVISLSEFLDRGSDSHPRPECLITFDDAWKDNYDHAFPWLRRSALSATIFVPTGLIETGQRFWVEEFIEAWNSSAGREWMAGILAPKYGLAADSGAEAAIELLKHMSSADREHLLAELLGRARAHAQNGADRMMTWSEMLEMSRAGIEFGSHTVTHPLLTYETEDRVLFELRASKEVIGKQVGRPVRAFAYPNGDWDQRVRRLVEEAGYEAAFITRRGWYHAGQDLFSIRRIMLHERNVTGWGGKFSPAMCLFTLAGWR